MVCVYSVLDTQFLQDGFVRLHKLFTLMSRDWVHPKLLLCYTPATVSFYFQLGWNVLEITSAASSALNNMMNRVADGQNGFHQNFELKILL